MGRRQPLRPDQKTPAERPLKEGERLFNAGEYFEAHETFEDAWRAATGDTKLAYQALTQLAAAFHKIKTLGVSALGARYLLGRAREKLAAHGSVLGNCAPRLVSIIDGALDSLNRGQRPAWPQISLGRKRHD